MGRLSGKNVLVTAAAQGIGLACVQQMAEAGADVWATDIKPDVQARVGLAPDRSRVLDGTDRAAVASFIADCPTFDVVVHCVGIVDAGTVIETTETVWRRAFTINVDSYFHLLQCVLPGMVAAGRGSLVAIASVASSIKGLPRRAVYGASKAAMIGLTKSVAADYAPYGIRCNAVCPGTIETPSLQERIAQLGETVGGVDQAKAMFVARQPAGRIGTAAEVAALCLYLASDESAFVTGQAVAIDGGISI